VRWYDSYIENKGKREITWKIHIYLKS